MESCGCVTKAGKLVNVECSVVWCGNVGLAEREWEPSSSIWNAGVVEKVKVRWINEVIVTRGDLSTKWGILQYLPRNISYNWNFINKIRYILALPLHIQVVKWNLEMENIFNDYHFLFPQEIWGSAQSPIV